MAKEYTLYDNNLTCEIEKSVRKDMFDNRDVETSAWTSQESISDDELNEEWYELISYAWDDFKTEMQRFLDEHKCLVFGTVGTWHGQMHGGKFIRSFHDFCTLLNSCDNIRIYESNGHFHIVASHHDGTNYMEMKVLTDRGVISAQNNMWDNERQFHEHLWNRPMYTKLPRFMKWLG